MKGCDFIIVTVPTPVTSNKLPDLSPLIAASSMIGRILEHNVTVIYESTVYPGATEEVCVPVLEKESTLRCNKDFFVGYSPERINPGDKEHRINDILRSHQAPPQKLQIKKLTNFMGLSFLQELTKRAPLKSQRPPK